MEQYFVKVCLLGEGAVGKTSLIRKFVYDSYDDQYIKSIGVKVTKKKLVFEDEQIELSMLISDILGQMTKESLHASYLQGVKGVILVCDLTRHDTFERFDNWLQMVRNAVGEPPIILLGNKADLKDHREVGDGELKALAKELGCVYLDTSAKTGENVEKAFELIGRSIVLGGGENRWTPDANEAQTKEGEEMPFSLPGRESQDSGAGCPNCGSADVQVFLDGSGICENCEALLGESEIKSMGHAQPPFGEITNKKDVDDMSDNERDMGEDDVGENTRAKVSEEKLSRPVQMSFFNVPVAALRELRDRLSILLASRQGSAESVMEEYGYDCGKAAAVGMDVKCARHELSKVLPDLWIGIGLSKVDVDSISEDRIELAIYEMEIEEPDFFGGYLAGVVSGMLGEEFKFTVSDMEDYLKITLEPGIQMKVTFEETSTEAEKYSLDRGSSYILKQTNEAFNVFKEKVTHGMEGMCITREYPPRVKEKYGLSNTPIYWFSDSSSKDDPTFNPSRLAFEAKRTLNDFMRESQSGIILLQGAEYLISHQGFSEVLKWLQGIRDQAAMSGTTILICADPEAMDEKEFRNLSIEFSVLEASK